MYALNSMRIEKGYRAWKGDLSTDYTLLEGGTGALRQVRQSAGLPGQGRACCVRESKSGRKKGFVTMTIDDECAFRCAVHVDDMEGR